MIGLLAGSGYLPFEFVKGAKERQRRVLVFAIEGITNPEIREIADSVSWFKPFKLGKFLKALKNSGVSELAILGKVEHKHALSLRMLDLKALSVLLRLPDRKPETIIRAFIREVEKLGVKVIDPTEYLSHILAPEGVIASAPNGEILKDIELGFKVAKAVATLDVGQTVVVKNGVVVAVEALEGTDNCIRRAHELVGKGFVVCKAARRRQDMRIDVPTVGSETLELIHKLGGKALAVEAGKTFIPQFEKFKETAQKLKICVIGVKAQQAQD